MNIRIPELSLIVLIGASGSGKSTFAKTQFLSTEILSSDYYRAVVSDDENNQEATTDAFDVLQFVAAKRLKAGRLNVVDATNVQKEARKPYIELARKYHCLPVAIVLNVSERVCQERNRNRSDRNFGSHVIRNQRNNLRSSLSQLEKEGFRRVIVLNSVEEINSVTITREPLWNNKKSEHGPFDIIGDIHGCYDELVMLLSELSYTMDGNTVTHPENRKVIFLGDLVDRGPRIIDTLKLAAQMVSDGVAICLPGNHENKLLRYLNGKNVQITHGLDKTIVELENATNEYREELKSFLDGLVGHYVLDDGKLVVAHAGIKESMQGRASGEVRSFALYGETTGETDEFGLPIRYNWANEYRGKATVVYGHTPVPAPQWLNNTINIDTGCVFGGKLTTLRYPERTLVSIDALNTYSNPLRPLQIVAQETESDTDILDIEDVSGKRIINTSLINNITIREENAVAALEAVSRFTLDPRWLIYIPPTMSPPETSALPDYLEHPIEALDYFTRNNISRVICEQKHMGSRAIVIVCKDADAANRRFHVQSGIGCCYTRTGRRFFNDNDLENQFLMRIQSALSLSNVWDLLNTDWVCMDCELMPWSAKALDLVKKQYAGVASAAKTSLDAVIKSLNTASSRYPEAKTLLTQYQERKDQIDKYTTAYRNYCWPVTDIASYKIAPFHILCSEGATHIDKNHLWHMNIIKSISDEDPDLIINTPFIEVDLSNQASRDECIQWWLNLTNAGGEGMVVKPIDFVVQSSKGIVQPAIKCRGREYLRIIYGPSYTESEHLVRLKQRGLSTKRSLAIREFALGIQAMERFINYEPLRRVHECSFAVLALESEPVDPRL